MNPSAQTVDTGWRNMLNRAGKKKSWSSGYYSGAKTHLKSVCVCMLSHWVLVHLYYKLFDSMKRWMGPRRRILPVPIQVKTHQRTPGNTHTHTHEEKGTIIISIIIIINNIHSIKFKFVLHFKKSTIFTVNAVLKTKEHFFLFRFLNHSQSNCFTVCKTFLFTEILEKRTIQRSL